MEIILKQMRKKKLKQINIKKIMRITKIKTNNNISIHTGKVSHSTS